MNWISAMVLAERSPAASRRLAPITLVIFALAGFGSARAQSCTQPASGQAICQYMLSQPQSLSVIAVARLTGDAQGAGATLSVTVDGSPCGRPQATRFARNGSITLRCRPSVTTSASPNHLLQARLTDLTKAEPVGITVRLVPSERLGDLPREQDALGRHGRPRGWWRTFQPF